MARLFENLHRSGSADAAGAGVGHSFEVVVGANAAGGFDAKMGADGCPHESDVGGGRAGLGETGGGLDEVGAGLFRGLAGGDLLLVVQESGFEDDLEDGSPFMASIGDGADIGFDGGEVAGFQGAYIEDHVDFGSSVGDGFGGLGALVPGGGGAERETDDGADFDGRAAEFTGDEGDPVGVDADGGEDVFAGFFAYLAHVGFGGVGAEDGVVDERRKAVVDAGKLLAGGDAAGPGGDDLLRLLFAGLGAAAGAIGTNECGDVEAFSPLGGSGGGNAGEDLFGDLGDELFEGGFGHWAYFFSRAVILSTRDWWRPAA